MRFMDSVMGIALLLYVPERGVEAQGAIRELGDLAGRVAQSLSLQGFKSVAAVDFADLQGRTTELGRFLADQLTVEIVAQNGLFMVDRANIRSILAEHKLTEEGLVDPANAKRLGEFAGVDAILVGTVTALDSVVVLSVRAIATSSSRVVAAGSTSFGKTREIQQLLLNLATLPSPQATPNSPISAGLADGPSTVHTRDFGPLRVSVTTVRITSLRARNSNNNLVQSGVQCVLRVTNLAARTAMLAVNLEPPRVSSMGIVQNADQPPAHRFSLAGSDGVSWEVQTLRGIGAVRAGVYGNRGSNAYNAGDIARLLARRDELGRDYSDPMDRFPDPRGREMLTAVGNRFVSGSLTTLEPGESVEIVVDFVPSASANRAPERSTSFALVGEAVLGLRAGDGKWTYSLLNLVFDSLTRSTE